MCCNMTSKCSTYNNDDNNKKKRGREWKKRNLLSAKR